MSTMVKLSVQKLTEPLIRKHLLSFHLSFQMLYHLWARYVQHNKGHKLKISDLSFFDGFYIIHFH